MNTDTPRTHDKTSEFTPSSHPDYDGPITWVPADFSSQLERELAAEQDKCKRLREALVTIRDECFSGCAHDVAERALATLEATK